MYKFCIFVGMTAFGWLGWWVAEDFGLMTAFLCSSLGSMIGVFIGWWINRKYFE